MAQPKQPELSPPSEIFPICKQPGFPRVSIASRDMARRAWKGWGTALSWWTTFIGAQPQAEIDSICDLLFDAEKGLGLNIVRYQIGAGFDPRVSPHFASKTDLVRFRVLPAFQSQPGVWDWSADQPQRNVLLGAKKRGVDTFIAFALSPLPWMTVTGDTAGSANGKTCNLRPECYDAYADYLTEVVKHYEEEPSWNIKFDVLEPLNEPNDGGWKAGGRQEGCSYSPAEMSRLYEAVAAALRRKGMRTPLAGTDGWFLTVAKTIPQLSPHVVNMISEWHGHGYLWPQAHQPWSLAETQYGAIRDTAAKYGGKEVWQTEWCPLKQAGNDTDVAVFMARNIVEFVNIAQGVAWCYWQGIDMGPRFTTINVRWNPQSSKPHVPNKKYYVLKQFVTFAPKGSYAVIPQCALDSFHCITSFYNPAKHTLNVFVVNQQANTAEIEFTIAGFGKADPNAPSQILLHRTSEAENVKSWPPIDWDFTREYRVPVLGRSLTTIEYTNIAPLNTHGSIEHGLHSVVGKMKQLFNK